MVGGAAARRKLEGGGSPRQGSGPGAWADEIDDLAEFDWLATLGWNAHQLLAAREQRGEETQWTLWTERFGARDLSSPMMFLTPILVVGAARLNLPEVRLREASGSMFNHYPIHGQPVDWRALDAGMPPTERDLSPLLGEYAHLLTGRGLRSFAPAPSGVTSDGWDSPWNPWSKLGYCPASVSVAATSGPARGLLG